MSITLRHHGKISDYRAKTLLEAKDKKEATQLRGIRGWLQNKLSPGSGLRNLFGITEREQKLEIVWEALHKPQAKDAKSNVNKIVTFHILYNLMDKETKKKSVFRVNVANNALSGKKLEFIINDKPIASFKHFEKDEKTIRELNDGVISNDSHGKIFSTLKTYDEKINYNLSLNQNCEDFTPNDFSDFIDSNSKQLTKEQKINLFFHQGLYYCHFAINSEDKKLHDPEIMQKAGDELAVKLGLDKNNPETQDIFLKLYDQCSGGKLFRSNSSLMGLHPEFMSALFV